MNFCTHFDSNYLPQAMTLLKSLNDNIKSFNLFMLCMDDKSYEYLKSITLKNARILHYSLIEDQMPDLVEAKKNRNNIEYFFTCSPAVCKLIFLENRYIESITYLDADLFFFSDPSVIFEEINDKSIAIIKHNFSLISRPNIKYGIFNVGWITFKNDYQGKSCLNNWYKNCIDWCYQKVERNRYADQKYLDSWPDEYKNLIVLKNKGANLAPWNISKYNLSLKDDSIFVDEDKLVFFHFANLHQIGHKKFKTNLSRVFKSTSGILKLNIYLPYIKELNNNINNTGIISISKPYPKYKSFFINILAKLYRNLRDLVFKDIIELN